MSRANRSSRSPAGAPPQAKGRGVSEAGGSRRAKWGLPTGQTIKGTPVRFRTR